MIDDAPNDAANDTHSNDGTITGLRAEVARLERIVEVLMDRAERSANVQTSDFGLFHTTVLLEELVRSRTAELVAALAQNERITRELRESQARLLGLQDQLRDQAVHDSLTGLYNRRALDDVLAHELERAHAARHEVAVVMTDLDHFKDVNDSLGHAVGDEVLRSVADLLRHSCRSGDTVCRYGGEEFVIVAPKLAAVAAEARAEQLRRAVATARFSTSAGDRRLTVSAGVSSYPAHGTTPAELLRAADEAMYAAKRAGRDCVRVAR